MMRLVLPICALALLVSSLSAATIDSGSVLLDTIAPSISITPQTRYQSTVFIFSLTSSEPGLLRYALDRRDSFTVYEHPVAITAQGHHMVYYFGEDYVGNRSSIDSIDYVLDTRPPLLAVMPANGRYRQPVNLRFTSDEPCRFFLTRTLPAGPAMLLQSAINISDSLHGSIVAVDSAGNNSLPAIVDVVIDTAQLHLRIEPLPGIYNKLQRIRVTAIEKKGTLLYSLDPLAPPEWFVPYSGPVDAPMGSSLFRCYIQDNAGWRSEIVTANFVIDTVVPRIRSDLRTGTLFDTLVLTTRKASVIRFTIGGTAPSAQSQVYQTPIVLNRSTTAIVRAIATDQAGNQSVPFEWRHRYDTQAPTIRVSPDSGIFVRPFGVRVKMSEIANIYYTLDDKAPTQNSPLVRDSILISREGVTVLRLMAVDESGNRSDELRINYMIDTRPPVVYPSIMGAVNDSYFSVAFQSDEPATIYYEIGDRMPTTSSTIYRDPVRLRAQSVLRFFAVDRVGNRSAIRVLDDLQKPLVMVSTTGGVFKTRLKIGFATNVSAEIFWRFRPDTLFHVYTDSLALVDEGQHSLEYYSMSPTGWRSAVRREEYLIDLTPPGVTVNVKKGLADSANVFFECSENATIYYTLDGSDPQFSTTVRLAGNKFFLYSDRVAIARSKDIKLTFFAEDMAGNRSPQSSMDIFRPRAIPDVPAGADRVANHILSVSFYTLDGSRVFFARHGKSPTSDSTLFVDPIILVTSDTILTLAMDPAGFSGDIDTFFYRIDLPPISGFTGSSDTVIAGQPVTFTAVGSSDQETPFLLLGFQWNLDGDTVFETSTYNTPKITHTFFIPGIYRIGIKVSDASKQSSITTRQIWVRPQCPSGMVAARDTGKATFCIDIFEWPNLRGKTPLTGVNWVDAFMYCRRAGKRLCSGHEWQSACQGNSAQQPYPYGTTFEKERCPVEGKTVYRSGSYSRCNEQFGTSDMTGNVWEWVADRDGEYAGMAGGAVSYGKNATCLLGSKGPITTRGQNIGFRCCK